MNPMRLFAQVIRSVGTPFTAMLLFLLINSASSESFTPGVTMVNYSRLKTGMTYAQVVKILGKEGIELSSGDIAGIHTAMYQWYGHGISGSVLGANMNAMFQDGRLVTKAQFGLR